MFYEKHMACPVLTINAWLNTSFTTGSIVLTARCKIHINKQSYSRRAGCSKKDYANEPLMRKTNRLPGEVKKIQDEKCRVFQFHELYAEQTY
jgi:hypothetical protein